MNLVKCSCSAVLALVLILVPMRAQAALGGGATRAARAGLAAAEPDDQGAVDTAIAPPAPSEAARNGRNALAPERAIMPQDDDPGRPEAHPLAAWATVGGGYALLYGYTWLAWYSRTADSPHLNFHDEGFFSSATYAGGADKLGHMWSNYVLVRSVAGILDWGGASRAVALTTSVGLAQAFFLLVEVKDGYKLQYGFSWGDVLFNSMGNALGVIMTEFPEIDRRIDLKVDYFPSKYYLDDFASEGLNSAEDYSGQRMLLAYHLASIDALRQSKATSWLRFFDVVVGYRANHFKPDASDPSDHVEELYLGVAINFQQMVDEWMMPASGRVRDAGAGTRVTRFLTEVWQLPFTTAGGNIATRTSPDDVGPTVGKAQQP
jgi:hypothetical protein